MGGGSGVPRNKASRGNRSRTRKRKASDSVGKLPGRPSQHSKTTVSDKKRNLSARHVSLKTDATTEEEAAFRAVNGKDVDDASVEGDFGAEKKKKRGRVRQGVAFEDSENRGNEEVLFEQKYYDLLERVCVPEPILSFDFVRDGKDGKYSWKGVKGKGSGTKRRMLRITTMCGFQFKNPFGSTISLTKLDNLRLEARSGIEDSDSSVDGEDDGDDEDDEGDEDEKDEEESARGMFRSRTIEERSVQFAKPVNRLRTNPFNTSVAAAWTEADGFSIVDTSLLLRSLNKRPTTEVKVPKGDGRQQNVFTSGKHKAEGFALDWSHIVTGRLATGACNGSLCVIDAADQDASSWVTGSLFRNAHEGSVEDIKWSPGEKNVFASGSVDRSIRFWDVRSSPYKSVANICNAHRSDVNALSWNKYEQHLVLSGGDEGTIKVWDLRMVVKNKSGGEDHKPVGDLRFHQKPIGCIEWHPHDVSMFVACSWDDSVTIWDLSCERDVDVELAKGIDDTGSENVPPQLLFTHKGRGSVTECHWHPIYDSVVVASSEIGMDIFKPCNVSSSR